MTLDDAIINEEKIVKEQEKLINIFKSFPDYEDHRSSIVYGHHIQKARECAEEHIQLAEWLKDYKRLKEQEPILDKIYADIQKLRGCSCYCSDGIIDDVEDIIDAYKAEMEGKR